MVIPRVEESVTEKRLPPGHWQRVIVVGAEVYF